MFPDWWEGREVDEKDALGKKTKTKVKRGKGSTLGAKRKGSKRRKSSSRDMDDDDDDDDENSDVGDDDPKMGKGGKGKGKKKESTAEKAMDGRHNRMMRALQACTLMDVTRRLGRDEGACSVRFDRLEQIPCFEQRWRKAPASAQGLLWSLIEAAEPLLVALVQARSSANGSASNGSGGGGGGVVGVKGGGAADKLSAVEGAKASKSTDPDDSPRSEEEVLEYVKRFSGVPVGATLEEAGKIFLELMSVLTSARKFDLFHVAMLLGVAVSLPPILPTKWDVELHEEQILINEPKFK